MQLIESDDPLEAGLEILAKPPGKKPATLSLLSGGEQALTALALIFAVFLTNPAPICVLDEVDAPLDDHNVERFCDLLDEMTKLDRHPLRDHHPQPDHHGAHEPPVRRHHGRARRVAAGLGRSGSRGADQGGRLTATDGRTVLSAAGFGTQRRLVRKPGGTRGPDMFLPAGRAEHARRDLGNLRNTLGSVSIAVDTGSRVMGHLIITELM